VKTNSVQTLNSPPIFSTYDKKIMVYQYKNTSNTLPKGSGALMVELSIGTMALQNLQQYGCQTGNKLKEKSCDLNRNSSRFFLK
jgi:hypothetical protein